MGRAGEDRQGDESRHRVTNTNDSITVIIILRELILRRETKGEIDGGLSYYKIISNINY